MIHHYVNLVPSGKNRTGYTFTPKYQIDVFNVLRVELLIKVVETIHNLVTFILHSVVITVAVVENLDILCDE